MPREAPPRAPDPMDAGRRLFRRPCVFMVGAARLEQLPAADLPEICMAGRSNVGKSSLINAMTDHNGLARVSVTPGRTQQINVFSLDGRMLLADLPGYGYARAPRARVGEWTALARAYLRARPNLRRAMLLIDSRHGVKANDREVMAALDKSAVNYQIVLTKTDKITDSRLHALAAATRGELAKRVASHPTVLAVSSANGQGLDALRAELAAIADSHGVVAHGGRRGEQGLEKGSRHERRR